MKRWILLLLTCLLLAGCGNNEPTEATEAPDPTGETQVTETTAPTEPTLLQSDVEGLSTFRLEEDACAGFFPWGPDRYVLLSTTGKLHLLTGDALNEEKVRDLECTLTMDDPSIRVSGDQLCYFDRSRDAYVTLGRNLTEVSAITIRDDVTAGPVMDDSFGTIYYATADGVRALDISTGNSRLLRQEHQPITEMDGLCFDGTTLHYKRLLENGVEQDCFIRVADGTLVDVATLNGPLVTWGRSYAAVMDFQLPLTRYREILCGSLEGTPQRLVTDSTLENVLFPGNGTVLLQESRQLGLELLLYDLETGDRIARYVRQDWEEPFTHARFEDGDLWLWMDDSGTFLRMDTTTHERVSGTLEPLATLSAPAALDSATALAQEIADAYGVVIELTSSDNRTTGVNYDAWPDYRPQEYEAALALLKQTMDSFPAGLFQRLKLTIRLVDDFDPAQDLPAGTGELIIGDRRVMELSICDNLLEIFYHELFHAMELYITSETKHLSKWTDLNPEGLTYAGSTIPYETGELAQSEYLYAVADDYGLVSAREDRAQIFLYAMMDGQEELFANETVQAKLSYLCTAIRYAWNWRKVDAVFPWERYLTPTE